MSVPWKPISSIADVQGLEERSHTVPCLILKHSTSCNISAIAKYRLDDDWDFEPDALEPYFLDLLRYRATSGFVAETFRVHHESPQILLIVHGECVFDTSHLDISVAELKEALSSVKAS